MKKRVTKGFTYNKDGTSKGRVTVKVGDVGEFPSYVLKDHADKLEEVTKPIPKENKVVKAKETKKRKRAKK